MDRNMLMIVVVVLLVVVILVVRYVVSAGVNKAGDAIQNAWANKKNAENPPQQVSLAERYGQASTPNDTIKCAQCGNTLPSGTKFCNKCGATLDNGQ